MGNKESEPKEVKEIKEVKPKEIKVKEEKPKDVKTKEVKVKEESIQNLASEFGEVKTQKKGKFVYVLAFLLILSVVGVCAYFAYQSDAKKKEEEAYTSRMEEIYNSASTLLEKGEYKNALEELKKIESSYKDYEKVELKITEVTQQYLDSYLEKAEKLLEEKEYDEAIKVLQNVDEMFKGADLVKEKIVEIELAQIKEKIDSLVIEEDYIGVIEYANSKLGSEYTQVDEELNVYIDLYKQKLIEAISELIKVNYEDAIVVLNKVIAIIPEDTKLLELLAEAETYRPTPLGDIAYYEKTGDVIVKMAGTVKDTMESHYTDYLYTTDENGAISYKIDKKYNKFTGVVCLNFTKNTTTTNTIFRFYGDDTLIYESPNITAAASPIPFEIDVSNVTFLKIEIVRDAYATGINAFIGTPVLQK
ncbi:MAG: NPCBM/NEW2 domain-containing protein [Lachnospiraceae bacterium]|jgi:tetratricopeptide (TPR) repeat protein|nr:NPCBM/NEW2 domain-containing protein [Lachnospiraceae bacterium]